MNSSEKPEPIVKSEPVSDPLVSQLCDQLDSSNGFDLKTQLRLKQVRQQALIQGKKNRQRRRFWQFTGIPITALAVLLITFQLSSLTSQQENRAIDQNLFQDLELLAAEEEMEFLQQLEFIEWLESNRQSLEDQNS